MKDHVSRRQFLETASLAGAGLSLALPQLAGSGGSAFAAEAAADKPAKLGGQPVCSGGWPGWPVYDETEEKALVLSSPQQPALDPEFLHQSSEAESVH